MVGFCHISSCRGWSRIIDNVRAKSSYLERHGEEQFRAAIGVALKNRDIAAVPYLLDALKNPDKGANSLIVDILLNSSTVTTTRSAMSITQKI